MKLINPDEANCPCFVLSESYEAFEGPWHSHERAQFVYADHGLMTEALISAIAQAAPEAKARVRDFLSGKAGTKVKKA